MPRQGRRRHVPYRTCVACRTPRQKRELVRIVRTPEGAVVVDERGKQNGRGAYLCAQRVCWQTALAQARLERALKVKLDSGTIDALQAYATGLPEALEQIEGEPKEE